MTSQVGTLLTSVASSLTTAIGDALPIAGTILASVAGIYLGIKLFKKVTGAKS
jgi:hypothetical protein